MASRDVALLHPKMIPFVEAWIRVCPVPVMIYCTVREAWEQAQLYSIGRTQDQLESGAARLRGLGLDAAARFMEQVIPTAGRRVTNALPGLSFHQPAWLGGELGALALDFVPVLGGKPLWNDTERYKAAGEAAEGVGLTWAGRWTSFKETAHLQMDRRGEIKALPLAKGAYK